MAMLARHTNGLPFRAGAGRIMRPNGGGDRVGLYMSMI